ncbi:MAG TPA: hypothetical protein VF186_05655 [Gaiellaceae bacterium]|jgi:hypothetical protein
MDERRTSPELELRPEQPPEVERALAELLDDRRPVDPWWRAGNEEARRSNP